MRGVHVSAAAKVAAAKQGAAEKTLDNVQTPEELARLVVSSADGAINAAAGRPASRAEIAEMIEFYQRCADELRRIAEGRQ